MAQMQVRVVVGPGLALDRGLLAETVQAECAALGVGGRVTAATDASALRRLLAAGADPVVVLPGPEPAVRSLLSRPGGEVAGTVWCDLHDTGPQQVSGGAAHVYGRGFAGVSWAIRHAVYRFRWPARRVSYGPGADQWGELRLPAREGRAGGGAGAEAGPAPVPVAVLLHGGYWRSRWGADLMDALAVDLAGRGFASWNLEYRRPDLHGWEATVADVATGLDTLRRLPDPLDLTRVAVLGHSAGGQLALRVVADAPWVAMVVPLAGVVGLAEGWRRWLGNGGVAAALEGSPVDRPDRYAAADPSQRLPLEVRQLVVQGRHDDLDLVDLNRQYVAAARAAGDQVDHLELPGDHYAVISPGAPIWQATATWLTRELG